MGRVCVFGCPGEEGRRGLCEAVFTVGFSGELWIPGSGRYILDVCIHGFGKGVWCRFSECSHAIYYTVLYSTIYTLSRINGKERVSYVVRRM